ncbi:hypothetical protein MJN83_12070, partial [Salmonella enterica subsp. enterica serovar Cerro]|nr:hypothetical protein [Salmonella enterica subsp. enterica serovar Cerro]
QDNAGDPVVLWGEGLPVERIAEMTKVSAYELITRLTSRVAMKRFLPRRKSCGTATSTR